MKIKYAFKEQIVHITNKLQLISACMHHVINGGSLSGRNDAFQLAGSFVIDYHVDVEHVCIGSEKETSWSDETNIPSSCRSPQSLQVDADVEVG